MADDQIQVQITADTSDFDAAMAKVSASAQQSFTGLQQSSAAAGKQIDQLGSKGQHAGNTGQTATQNWARSFTNLDGAFNSSITGMIMGTTTWQKAVQRVSQTALSDLVSLCDKQLATWIATQTGMTTATATASTARQVTNEKEQSGLLSLLVEALAQWLGFESAKTSASGAAAAAASAIDVARGLSMIEISASEAAAAAFADSAMLGPEGLAAAPAAATAAFGMTMGWGAGLGGAIASAAGGMWTVPSDMLAMVHQQESILPANVAQPMRDFFSGGAAAGAGGSNVAITIQAIDTQSGAQFLLNNANVIAQGLARELRNNNPALTGALR